MRTLEPWHREVARRLLAADAEDGERELTSATTAFFEGLDSELQNLVGRVGARALKGRALRLASADHPVLDSLHVQQSGGGAIAGLPELAERSGPDELRPAVGALVGHMVGLLTSLLGAELTLRLLRRICPEVELDDAMLEEAPGGAE